MAKFNVIILKTSQVAMTVTIEADDNATAGEKAMAMAHRGEIEWDDNDSPDYDVDSVEESEDEN